MRVLIIGSGGREHCLAWKIKQSLLVDKVYTAPGNAGTALLGENVDIKADDIDSLLSFAKDENIGLTVVGPEAPLVAGIVDRFSSQGLKIFGPDKESARLEASKIFAKETMLKYNIPTAGFKAFDNILSAKEYIKEKNSPLVVKAEGLAGGKGVIVCQTPEEALTAVDLIMGRKKFGSAGERIVIEDLLSGEEVSILVVSDGKNIIPLLPSQDHKRAFDNDKGPNTGGMGAYCPVSIVNDALLSKIMKEIFYPLINGLSKDGRLFKGMLYGGLMIENGRPFVLEFNVRFGDPETQAVLPKLKSDLVDIMVAAVDGRIDKFGRLEWDERACVAVVLASGGYPGSYEKGKEIKGLQDLGGKKDVIVFHAGTQMVTSHSRKASPRGEQSPVTRFITNGGRVLNVVGLGNGLKEAREKVYKVIDNISFEGMSYRKDIGNRVFER